MYGEEHYLTKIERNTNAVNGMAIGVLKEQVIANIRWARELSSRLEQLDYQERDKTISNIHQVLDNDYVSMGFELTPTVSQKK